MAGKGKKSEIVYRYRSENERKAEAEGASPSNSDFLDSIYAWFFDVKSRFNQLFSRRSSSDKAIMDRADEDYIENTFKTPEARYRAYEENTYKKVSEIAKDKSVGFNEKIENVNDFTKVAGALAKGSDKDKKSGFTKSVYEKIAHLYTTKANLDTNDKEALKKYYEEVKAVSESLKEYSESHNPWGRLGKKRKEFADTMRYLLDKETESLEESNPSFTDEGMSADDIDEINRMTDGDELEEKEKVIPKEKINVKDISEKEKDFGKTSMPGMSEKSNELENELGS